MRVPVRRPLVALLATVLVAAGCSGSSDLLEPDRDRRSSADGGQRDAAGDFIDQDAADFAAISRLLSLRAKALLRGDRRRFLATVDPSDRMLRLRQAALFDNLQVLPVDKVFYGLERSAMVADELRGSGRTLRPPVVEHVQLSGVTRRPISNQVTMTFVNRDGRWLLGKEREDPSFEAQFRPWYGVRIEAAGDRDLVVITDKDADTGAEELLESTRSALAGVVDVLDQPVEDPLVVDATTNGEATELSSSSGEDAGAVSFSTYATDRIGQEDRGKAGEVIKANPDYIDQLVEDDGTLRHELTHYVLTDYGRSNPQWVTEGIAEYVGYQPGTLADSFIEDEELERLIDDRPVRLTPPGRWGDQPQLDYLSAEAFAEFLITGYGLDDYLEMMDLFRRISRSRGVVYGEGVVDEVLERVYDLDPEDVARGGFDLLQGL